MTLDLVLLGLLGAEAERLQRQGFPQAAKSVG